MQKLKGSEIKEFLRDFDFSDLIWSVPKERRFEIDLSDLEDNEIYVIDESFGFFHHETDKDKVSFLDLFRAWNKNEDSSLTIPAEKVERWTQQVNTDYSELTDKEKESYRHQADKTVGVINAQMKVNCYKCVGEK